MLEAPYRRLVQTRRLRPVTAIVARFTEIEGGTLGAMVSVQLFTTVIPLMIMGFSYMRGCAWCGSGCRYYRSGSSGR